MLFLTRKPIEGQDTIVIGGDIRIVIRRVDGDNQVRVGIDAPPSVRIMREEIIDRGKS